MLKLIAEVDKSYVPPQQNTVLCIFSCCYHGKQNSTVVTVEQRLVTASLYLGGNRIQSLQS